MPLHLSWFKKAANNSYFLGRGEMSKGHLLTQYQLGDMYYDGIGVTQDYTQAFKWYEQAAKNRYRSTVDGSWSKGSERAQYLIALMYYKGLGVNKDKAMAKEWLEVSCDNDYQASCDYLQKLSK